MKVIARLAAHLASSANNTMKSDPSTRETQFVEARDLALRAKELDPNEQATYDALGLFAMNHGDGEGAKRAIETALSLDPKNPGRYHNLAAYYGNVGEPEKAVELLAQAIRLDPRRADENTLGNMGVAQFMLGNDNAAIDWFQKSLDRFPNAPDYRAYLAMAYARKGDRARSQAVVVALLRAEPKFTLLELDSPSRGFPPAFREFWETKLLPAYRLTGLPE